MRQNDDNQKSLGLSIISTKYNAYKKFVTNIIILT